MDRMTKMWILMIFIGVLSWFGNFYFVSSSFENDLFFSHLSDVEREMSFRSEMGLYYSYYKRIVDAPTFLAGVKGLLHDNLTEYPSTINVVSRFNIYPEIFIGASYRVFRNILNAMNLTGTYCYEVDRGTKVPVTSCEGLGVPIYFYLNAVWNCAGLSAFLLSVYGTLLSESIVGGALTVLSFFFNHSECTRVQWTPPLRESFAYPFLLSHCFFVSLLLKESHCGGTDKKNTTITPCKVALLTSSSCFSLVFWQFSQLVLASETLIFISMFVVGNIDKATTRTLLKSLTVGHVLAVIILLGNSMLVFSILSTTLSSSWMLLALDKSIRYHLLSWKSIVKVGVVVGLSISLKLFFSADSQDAHISSILLTKLGMQSRNFHTSLYTCAPEFQAISMDYVKNITTSLLLPCSFVSVLAIVILFMYHIAKFSDSSSRTSFGSKWKIINQAGDHRSVSSTISEHEIKWSDRPMMSYLEPLFVYNLCLLLLYVFMALIAMRLKLFLTPQLCIFVSLLASQKVQQVVQVNCFSFAKETVHYIFLAVVICAMCKPGFDFLHRRMTMEGEYTNIPLEELLTWIIDFTPVTAAFAGPMPVMASILLSTGRPIVNHPHYEDVEIRRRTKDVYSVFSKKPPHEAFLLLEKLKVNYLVLSSDKCVEGNHRRDGCKMTDIWDLIDPENINRPPLCPQLFNSRPTPLPFQRVYKNNRYAVLKVLSLDRG